MLQSMGVDTEGMSEEQIKKRADAGERDLNRLLHNFFVNVSCNGCYTSHLSAL